MLNALSPVGSSSVDQPPVFGSFGPFMIIILPRCWASSATAPPPTGELLLDIYKNLSLSTFLHKFCPYPRRPCLCCLSHGSTSSIGTILIFRDTFMGTKVWKWIWGCLKATKQICLGIPLKNVSNFARGQKWGQWGSTFQNAPIL